jgi:hypothetical protein
VHGIDAEFHEAKQWQNVDANCCKWHGGLYQADRLSPASRPPKSGISLQILLPPLLLDRADRPVELASNLVVREALVLQVDEPAPLIRLPLPRHIANPPFVTSNSTKLLAVIVCLESLASSH